MNCGAEWSMCVSSGAMQRDWVAVATLWTQALRTEDTEKEFINRPFELHTNHEFAIGFL